MLEYVAVCDSSAENGETKVWNGVAAYDGKRLIAAIPDLTPDFAEAERLAAELNRFGASLLHFHDIIEDYIAVR